MSDLTGLRVALSGSVPTLAELRRNQWDELGFRWMVKNLVVALFESGASIVHGCHPSFTPIVTDVARRLPRTQRPRVHLLVIRHFYPSFDAWEHFKKVHSYAAIEPVGSAETNLNEALSALAARLSECAHAFVCIGGRDRDHTLREGVAQIEQEVQEALKRRRPTYLLGGCGGLSQALLREQFRREPAKLGTGLEDAMTLKLAEATPWQAPALVVKGLQRLLSEGRLVPASRE